jgi:hypothetical protein
VVSISLIAAGKRQDPQKGQLDKYRGFDIILCVSLQETMLFQPVVIRR